MCKQDRLGLRCLWWLVSELECLKEGTLQNYTYFISIVEEDAANPINNQLISGFWRVGGNGKVHVQIKKVLIQIYIYIYIYITDNTCWTNYHVACMPRYQSYHVRKIPLCSLLPRFGNAAKNVVDCGWEIFLFEQELSIPAYSSKSTN